MLLSYGGKVLGIPAYPASTDIYDTISSGLKKSPNESFGTT